MPKLFSSKQIITTLQKRGFVFVSQRGSHIKMRNLGAQIKTVIVPVGKKEIPRGTFRSILRQSGLGIEDFEK